MRYLLLLLPVLAFADRTDIEIENKVITGDVTSENSTLALAQSLGDVDIGRAAECVITEQYGIIIWQRQNWEYDPWCIAGILDEQGKHYEAAQMRCFHKPTLKLYGDQCIEILTFDSPPPVIPSLTNSEPEEKDDDEARAQQQEEIDTIENRLAKIEAGNRATAKAAQRRRDYAQQTLEKVRNYDPEK